MNEDYPNQNLNRSKPVPNEIAVKYGSNRYSLCSRCKHLDEVCDDCVSVQTPIIATFGLFSEGRMFYHAKFEKVGE